MKVPLKVLAATTVDDLSKQLPESIDRYVDGDFVDLAKSSGWQIETKTATWNPAIAERLDPSGSPQAEIENSLLVYRGLEGVTPALAREERLWARLCHVDCLEYARRRWLSNSDAIEAKIRTRFFAPSLVGCRDRNAIGRLWWNGHIASLACPDDLEHGLRTLLRRANFRLQIVDRADTAFRQPLVAAIVRILDSEPWFDSADAAIAHFMREVNKRSGSVIFEAMSPQEIDDHLQGCLEFAQRHH